MGRGIEDENFGVQYWFLNMELVFLGEMGAEIFAIRAIVRLAFLTVILCGLGVGFYWG